MLKNNTKGGFFMYKNFKQLSDKYEEGFRCIHKDKSESTGCTYTLRNFDKGKIYTISSQDSMEIGEMEQFLENLEKIKRKTGYDCICTGYETDD